MKNFVVLTAPVTAAAVLSIAQAQASEIPAFVEFESRWHSENSQAGFNIMQPFRLDSSRLFFVDANGSIMEGDVQKGSIGVGYRFQTTHGFILGVNGYYDYLTSSLGNGFHQLSVGTELLGPIIEARANLYLPFGGDVAVQGAGRGVIDNGTLRFREGREQARPGADAEIGFKIPQISDDGNAELKFFGGSYWYGGKNISDMFGGKLRAELAVANLPGLPTGSTVSFGAAATYDNENKLGGEILARLRIPFGGTGGGKPLDPFDLEMQGVRRALAIKTHVGATGELEDAILDINGRTAGKIVTVSAADKDAATVNARLAAAGTNALALADGDIGLNGSLLLGDGQLLLGGGGALALHGAASGGRATFFNSGISGRLTSSNAAQNVVTMASNSIVSYISLSGGLAGIGSTGASNLLIDNVDISGTAHDGIRLAGVDGATIRNSKIHDLFICENSTLCEFSIMDPNKAPYAAVSAHGTRNLTVRDTQIDSVTYGVFAGSAIDDRGWPPAITDLASNIRLDNVAISRSRREGVLLVAADKVEMNKVTVDNSAQGLDMDLVVLQGSSNVSITDMVLKGGINGLMLVSSTTLPHEAKTTNVNVNGLQVDGTRNAGIFFNPVSGINLKNVSITNAGTYGMFVYGDDWGYLGGPVANITFEKVVIDHASKAGLYFMGPSEDLTGDITVRNTPRDCKSDPSWMGGLSGSITQSPGSTLLVNGKELGPTTFDGRCG